MECPRDGAELVAVDKGGVEIDYCPSCRGVWLDRGELDKILEQSRAMSEHEKWSQEFEARRDQARVDRHKSEAHPVSDLVANFFSF